MSGPETEPKENDSPESLDDVIVARLESMKGKFTDIVSGVDHALEIAKGGGSTTSAQANAVYLLLDHELRRVEAAARDMVSVMSDVDEHTDWR